MPDWLKKVIARLTQNWLIHQLMWIAVKIVVPGRRMGAGVVVFNEAGQILLLRHAFHGSHPWGLPGGWLNRKEEPADAVMRELREETGLTARLGPVIWFGNTIKPPDLNAYYIATHPVGDYKLSFEIIEAKWFEPDKLPSQMLQMTHDVIGRAIQFHRTGVLTA